MANAELTENVNALKRWIDVNEQLPSRTCKNGDSDDVLVWRKKGYATIAWYETTRDEWWSGMQGEADIADVTHWMPLPSGPK